MPRVRSLTAIVPVSLPMPYRSVPGCALRSFPRSPRNAWRSVSSVRVTGSCSRKRCDAVVCALAPAQNKGSRKRLSLMGPKLRGYAVSASLLRPVQGFVSGLHDLIGRSIAMIPLRHTDAHGDRDGLATLAALVGLRLWDAWPEPAPHCEPARFDRLAQLFEMRQAFLLTFTREYQREFLAAGPIGRSAARGLRQPPPDESEGGGARVVAGRIVARLEGIDVDHGAGE